MEGMFLVFVEWVYGEYCQEDIEQVRLVVYG